MKCGNSIVHNRRQPQPDTRVNIGDVHYNQHRYESALEYYHHALTAFQIRGNKGGSALCLQAIGYVDARLGKYGDSEAACKRALEIYESLSEQISEPSEVGAFQDANIGGLYIFYASLLAHQKRNHEALIVVERSRGQGLARQAQQNRTDFSTFLSKQDAMRWKEANIDLTAATNLLRDTKDKLKAATNSIGQRFFRQRVATAQKQFEQADGQLLELRADLYNRYPNFKRLRGVKPPTFAELKSLTDHYPDTLFLEFAVSDDTMLLFALSHSSGLNTWVLPVEEKALAAQVEKWRVYIQNRDLRESQEVHSLSRLLLAPLETAGLLNQKRFRRLVIVADGPLLNIPFAALEDASGERLVEHYALSSSTSLTTLTWPYNQRKPTATLLCAAPFGDGKAQLTSAFRGSRDPLPGTRIESQRVQKLVPNTVLYVGPKATKRAITSALGKYALLHFATHGILDNIHGLRSALLFAPESPQSLQYDELEAREIVNLPMAARMAVLSACQSGLGQKSGGEGLLGLAWAFQAAGCPSIVASQWQVNDAATPNLMVAFYEGLMAGKPKDVALQAAMQKVQRENGHRYPFFWAAFQVFGDTRPIGIGRLAVSR